MSVGVYVEVGDGVGEEVGVRVEVEVSVCVCVGVFVGVDDGLENNAKALLLLQAVNTRDVPLLETVALIVAGTYATSNLLSDLSYAALDPRVRLG